MARDTRSFVRLGAMRWRPGPPARAPSPQRGSPQTCARESASIPSVTALPRWAADCSRNPNRMRRRSPCRTATCLGRLDPLARSLRWCAGIGMWVVLAVAQALGNGSGVVDGTQAAIQLGALDRRRTVLLRRRSAIGHTLPVRTPRRDGYITAQMVAQITHCGNRLGEGQGLVHTDHLGVEALLMRLAPEVREVRRAWSALVFYRAPFTYVPDSGANRTTRTPQAPPLRTD